LHGRWTVIDEARKAAEVPEERCEEIWCAVCLGAIVDRSSLPRECPACGHPMLDENVRPLGFDPLAIEYALAG